MRHVLNAQQMKTCDNHTTGHFGVASLVLQERAALAVCAHIDVNKRADEKREGGIFPAAGKKVIIFAGYGNNGADAVACARILAERGLSPQVYLAGNRERATAEANAQIGSARAYGIPFRSVSSFRAFSENASACLVIDGLVGVGLNRAPEGEIKNAILAVNELKNRGAAVISIDMPSGVSADDGTVYAPAVNADCTVTFAFYKTGQLLYPGTAHCGQLFCEEIGITEKSFLRSVHPAAFCYELLRDVPLGARKPDGHKGTFGKVLVVAGSKEMGGAAILAARAAFAAGAGMVRVLTAKENREALLRSLPEALCDVYDGEEPPEDIAALCKKGADWADAVVCGCGIGTGKTAGTLVETLLTVCEKPLLLDADALNLIAERRHGLVNRVKLFVKRGKPLVLTPHVGEFARLYLRIFGEALTADDIRKELMMHPAALARKMHAVVLCKDARSIACDGRRGAKCAQFINTSGNDGMACAGSGDVLSGLCGALLAGGADAFEGVCAGAYLHGLAGDLAARSHGKRPMNARNLCDALARVMKEAEAIAEDGGFVAP